MLRFGLISYILLVLVSLVAAETRTFYYSATWVLANPDGVKERPVISFNGSWPLPTIEVNKGDKIEFYLHNGLNDTETSIHFHGLYQNGSSWMDGPQMVTQCPVPVGETFLYSFTVDQSGTYWYHSHSGSQYSDGMRGMFIIHDKEIEENLEYEEELHVSISDWYHDLSNVLVKKQLTRYNPTGSEPIPQNMLFMDSRNVSINIESDKTYLLRIVNVGIMVSQYFFIEDHDFEIVEVDGIYVEPTKASMIYLTVGQRASLRLKTKKGKPTKNYCIITSFDTKMLDTVPEDLEVTSVNYLTYDEKLPLPIAKREFYDIESYKPYDDFNLKPLEKIELLPDPDYRIEVILHMENLGDGINYALFNNYTYVAPEVPTLYSVFSAPENYINDAQIYGSNTNSYVLNPGEVVELVINNEDDNGHPFHLHGHVFQAIVRSEEYDDPVHYDPEDPNVEFPDYPVLRDTMMVKGNGHMVLRFKSDNPGVWFFHCHLDFHLEQGLALTLIESPLKLQQQLIANGGLPADHLRSCKKSNTPYKGNAAGHTKKWLDLSGENLQPLPLPEGFTMKGYIAFIICTISALLGLRSIYDYGMKDVQDISTTGSSPSERITLLREKKIINELSEVLKKEEVFSKITQKQRVKLIGLIQETEILKKEFNSQL